ncbi:MAG: hypothetical protein KAR42_15550 [candidate division Zixibacteria bacterium]|nr:hypothetical protein [candidate division Zixibacteria bacterium]
MKPDFWKDEELSSITPEAALLAIGLLNHSDDEGYFKANPKLIEAEIFPLRELSVSIHELIKELSAIDYIRLFKAEDGKQYGLVTNFTAHQKINRPTPSKINELELVADNSLSNHGELTTGKERKGKEEEGKGKEQQVAECVRRVFDYWLSVMKKGSNTKLTDSRKKCIKARLKEGYEFDFIKQAIDGCASSPHHMGKNSDGTVYDDLTLICRTGDKLEYFAKNIRAGKKQDDQALEDWLNGAEQGNDIIEGEVVND